MDVMLTPANAARQLNLSASRLRAITEDGLIRAERTPGGHRRYEPSEVERLQELFARTGTAGVPRLSRIAAGSAAQQFDALWEGAHEWMGRQCRPLVRQAYARIEQPDGSLRDAGYLAELAFDWPDGRTRYFRYPWMSMLHVLALHEQDNSSLLAICLRHDFPFDPQLYSEHAAIAA